MGLASSWRYTGGDACAEFFSTALAVADPPVPLAARVLEIGCCEYDWLTPASATWPQMTFTGIDWRPRKHVPPRTTVIKGDVMAHSFAPASFDWIVSISAMEHIGLGHYDHDPTDPDGDVTAFDRCWQWLTPGGWFYFDVPWNHRYEVVGTSHRIYDDATIASRCRQGHPWREHWRGFAHSGQTSRLVPQPPATKGGHSFHYIGLWWQKPEN